MSYEKIEEQAKEYEHGLKREWCYIFAHGIIHLLGYDHQTKSTEKEMNGIVEEVMKHLGVNR
jgi:probable rRNA maturation factor